MTCSEGLYTKLLGLSIRREDDGLGGGSGSGSSPNLTNGSNPTIQPVRVTLTYPTSSANSTANSRQLILRLTSDTDPVFFYHLRLGESDYPVLKQNQGLLVDFTGFPAQLMSLLDKCEDDKFQLVMRCGRDMTILDIVESNLFKYLAHLSLFVIPGSDSEVKRYLAQVTIELKRENEGIRTQLQHMQTSLHTELGKKKEELDRKDVELCQLREEIRNESSATSERYFRDISLEKEKFMKFQSELTAKFETEKAELERRHRENILSVESKLSAIDNDKRQLEQGAYRTNSKLKDYEARLKANEEDLKILNQELHISKKNNNKLDSDYHEKQRSVLNLTNKLASCENDVKEKCLKIGQQQDVITTLEEKVQLLEGKNHNLGQEVAKMRHVTAELSKANDIIRKLQENCRQIGKDTKLQAQMLTNQENQLASKEKELTELREAYKNFTSTTQSLENDLAGANNKLEELELRTAAQAESLNTKQDMIDWLNKQLNDFQGLSNLSKFRQNLNESKLAGGGDTPSWMNIYNSTGATATGVGGLPLGWASRLGNLTNNNGNATNNTTIPSPPAGAGAANNSTSGANAKSQDEEVQKPAVTQRQPHWVKSNKVTLGGVLPNRSLPLWKK